MSTKEAERKFQFLQKFLNSSRKETRNATEKSTEKKSPPKKGKKDEDWLTKKALEELQREISINNVKRKEFGSVSAPKAKANKRFLSATIGQVLSHNERELNRTKNKSTDKLKELDRHQRLRSSKQKFGERKHEFQKPEKRKKRNNSSSSDD